MRRVLFLLTLPALALFVWPAIAAAQATPAAAAKAPPKSAPAVTAIAGGYSISGYPWAEPQACSAGGCGASGGLFVRTVARMHAFAEHRPVRGLFWRIRGRLRGGCG